MLSINNPVAGPYRSSTMKVLLFVLLAAFLVNTLAAVLAIQDYYLLKGWLADPNPWPTSRIDALQRQVVLRFISRLVVSAVLILCALAFVWQRRRNVSIHGELHRVERLARNVLESMVQGVIVVDGRGTIMNINPAALRLLCPTPEDQAGLVGRSIGELPAAGVELAELVNEAAGRAEPVWDRDLRIEQGGLVRRLRADAQALHDAGGPASGCIILLRDMTLSLLAEERMRRMERIAGLGDAATGLVHEIKNPLTALSIHLQLLEERLADPTATEPVGELFAVLNAEAERLNNVLDGFRDYAQLQSLAVQPTDAVAVLERVAHLIGPQAQRQGVRLALRRPAAALPRVPLDAEKFEQAVLNLTINALEAMPSGGDLGIDVEADPESLSVIVSDTGPGIPAEIRPHIFKPYFSTKVRGTGLGLALTEKLVGQHRGGIHCRSGPGGTSFQLAFPLAGGGAGANRAPHGREPLPNPDRG
jgi:nitrogen-specific signal transduction histidine kinase